MDPNSKYFTTEPYFSFNKRYYKAMQIDSNKPNKKPFILEKKQNKYKLDGNAWYNMEKKEEEKFKFAVENRDLLMEGNKVDVEEVYQIGKIKGNEKKYI